MKKIIMTIAIIAYIIVFIWQVNKNSNYAKRMDKVQNIANKEAFIDAFNANKVDTFLVKTVACINDSVRNVAREIDLSLPFAYLFVETQRQITTEKKVRLSEKECDQYKIPYNSPKREKITTVKEWQTIDTLSIYNTVKIFETADIKIAGQMPLHKGNKIMEFANEEQADKFTKDGYFMINDDLRRCYSYFKNGDSLIFLARLGEGEIAVVKDGMYMFSTQSKDFKASSTKTVFGLLIFGAIVLILLYVLLPKDKKN